MAIGLAVVGGSGILVRDAAACGGFFSRTTEVIRRPSLSHEQTLIVFDEAKQREHFIREVVFRQTSEPFGFVVPTPTRPEVAKVVESPFDSLRSRFYFQEPRKGFDHGNGRLGGGSGVRAPSVTILDVKRVGSFTAFVLAANDEGALGKWLGDNGFVTSKEAEPWLRHYVERKFYYVAMRYEPGGPPAKPVAKGAATAPPAGDAAAMGSETVRISFDTPLPYYPYFEPDRPAGVGDDRLLEMWLVTTTPHTPVAVQRREGGTRWAQPMAEGQHHQNARAALLDALGLEKARLGTGDLGVQVFVDQKTSRKGWGDVVFVPRAAAPADPARREALRRLVSTLDPTLPPSSAPRAAEGGGR